MAIDTVVMREALADAYATQALYLSLHTADPAGTGAAEVTGGSPAYVRMPLVWSADTTDDGSRVAAAVTFDVPAATTITHVGFWSTASGPTGYLDKAPFAVTFASQGTCTVTATYNQS